MSKINRRVKINDNCPNKFITNKNGKIVGFNSCGIVERQYIIFLDEPLDLDPFKEHQAFFVPESCLEYL
jgi:hypothetical protein